jgi:hypothetical protein
MNQDGSALPTAGPRAGDVVITKTRVDGATFYALRVFPGPPQIMCPTYEDGLTKALAWAGREAVSVWTTEDGQTYREETAPAAADGGATHASSDE